MKVLQERQGVTNSAFASILLLVLATLWITTTVYSAEIENSEVQTLLPNASPDAATGDIKIRPASIKL